MLRGKVVMITGASRGLGRPHTLGCSREGAKLAINSRSEDSLKPVTKEAGAEVLATPTDVSVGMEVQKLVEEAVRRFGRIDVLVNNAGLLGPRMAPGPFATFS